MKSSIKGFFVILAIVMSFVLVQGVYAQTYKGYVTEDTSAADKRTIGLDTDDDGDFNGETDVTIYGMGPLWFWEDVVDISYPALGEIVAIDAFYCEILGYYVGVTVYDEFGDVLIELRDTATLIPKWIQKAKSTDLSDTAVEATGDGVPNDPKDNNWDWDKDYNWNREQGPHGK